MTTSAPTSDPLTATAPDRRPRTRIPATILTAAIVFGLICGAFEITNTSIGWHIAAGRWMIEHHHVLDHDPFSFTTGSAEWIDHEWLFQIVAAVVHDTGGAPWLVILRMLLVAALMVLLLHIGTASGLDPPFALVLAALCVLGARPRFFLRPELFTLVLLPLALWLFADRRERRWWPLPLAAVIVLGANVHGAILVAPILISIWFAGELVEQLVRRSSDRDRILSGAAGVAAAFVAPLLNPYGPAIWTVPFTLAKMVRLPHVPNPEWISPTPFQTPWLYLAAALTALLLARAERLPQRWFTVAAAAALAFRHVRNLGLFFVLLPLTAAPALARLTASDGGLKGRRRTGLCLALTAALAFAALARPWPAAGFGFADNWYPDHAWAYLEERGLTGSRPLYNDVRFGGWLALHAFPAQQIFLDDRNEIHEPLLRRMWDIFAASDVAGWEALLDDWGIDTVLLRYHEPIRVSSPDGRDLGRRGFSALWLPSDRWALVYWDDTAMVLVRRGTVPQNMLDRDEIHALRPDDVDHVFAVAQRDPAYRTAVIAELERRLEHDPGCHRALALLEALVKSDTGG